MDYDLCVIGAGWAGFNAALSAVQLGKKVCVIEEKEIGGTCLNTGCIPTKAQVHYSKQKLALPDINQKKNNIISRLRSGMVSVLKSKQIDYFGGRARIESPHSVSIDKAKTLSAKFILIAAGSVSKDLSGLKIDHRRVLSSDDVLEMQEVPGSILIIGGGAIGCEFAGIFGRLGARVTIAEITPQLLPGIDAQISRKLAQIFQKAGVSVWTAKDFADLKLEEYEKILLAVGRKAVVDDLWAEGVDIAKEKGAIAVDGQLRTKEPSIFAAGDCIGGHMLAHVSSYEGELAARNMFLEPAGRDYAVVPMSVFTAPEIASVGASEEEARQSGLGIETKTAHFLANGMAHILEDTQGFLKIIIETKSGRIAGASVIGPQATDIINVFSVLMKNGISVAGVKNAIFAHPSVSEIIVSALK